MVAGHEDDSVIATVDEQTDLVEDPGVGDQDVFEGLQGAVLIAGEERRRAGLDLAFALGQATEGGQDLPKLDEIAGDDQIGGAAFVFASQKVGPFGVKEEIFDAGEAGTGVLAGPEVEVADHDLAAAPGVGIAIDRVTVGRAGEKPIAQGGIIERGEGKVRLESRRRGLGYRTLWRFAGR